MPDSHPLLTRHIDVLVGVVASVCCLWDEIHGPEVCAPSLVSVLKKNMLSMASYSLDWSEKRFT